MKEAKYLIYILLFIFPNFVYAQNNSERNNKLLIAAYEGKIDSVLHLLLDSADVNARNDEGITPLMYASEKGFEDIVTILLYNGADPNLVPKNGRTALISASIQNYPKIVYTLLLYGADINATDEYGVSALIYSSGYRLYDMVDYLVQNFANLNVKTNDSSTALMCASYYGSADIAGLLLKNKADPNAKDIFGFYSVSIAIQNGDVSLLDTLWHYNTDFKLALKTKQKVSAVDYARILNRRSAVSSLRKKGCKGSFWPYYNKVSINFNAAAFNTKDFFMGAGMGIFDSKYNTSFELGFNERLAKKRILEQQPDNTYYQLWEKRHYLYVSFEKLFCFKLKDSERRHGIFIRLKGLYSFGSFEGLNRKPIDKLLFVPGLGYSYMSDNFFVKAAYEYTRLDNYASSRHWITVTAGFFINFNRYKLQKKINWM
ncbi:MAG: ankyrin repeat domain-containing protein [Bacteroidota bacterium]